MEVVSVVLQVCGEIPPFIIGTGSREIDIACLLDGWTGIFAFLLLHTRAHAHRVVSNDLTSEVGGGGGNCCSNEPETGNGFARGVPMKSARRGKSNVYRLDAAKPRRKWFPVGCLPAGHRYCFVNIIIGRVERRSNGKSMRVISFYGGREKKKLNK